MSRETIREKARDRAVRARVAVYGLFLLGGTAVGTWTSRIPAVKERLDLGDGQFSIALLGLAGGAIAGMQLIGRLVDRHGSAKIMIRAAFLQAVVLIVPAYVPSLPALTAAMFAFGLVHGMLNVSMNANAVTVERLTGKPIMSSFHAMYSVGGFAGATTGGLLAHAGLGAGPTFLIAAAVIASIAALSARWALRDTPDPVRLAPGQARPRLPRGVLFLGVLAFCCLVGEGTAADWGSVYLREDLGASAGGAAAAYAAFSIMMTAGRFAGDGLAARFGPVRLVRACGLVASAGLGVGLLVGAPLAGVLGFGAFGAGLSCIIPQVFSAAGHRDPTQAGRALARVAGLGYLGFLSGPVLIGSAAELTSLPVALVIPVVLVLFVAVAATALRAPAKPQPQPETQPRVGTLPETQPETGARALPETQTETGAWTGALPETQAETETGAWTGAETGAHSSEAAPAVTSGRTPDGLPGP
ncbi:MFS transporter [Streptosporangiaceae bacterium NEAU-GS5]|nr:MFS transporter [Streptosporangiaceae bacterium NEAU-GS5]